MIQKRKISDDGIKNSNVKLIPKGTTLLSFKLSIGKTAIAGKDLYTNEAGAALGAPLLERAVARAVGPRQREQRASARPLRQPQMLTNRTITADMAVEWREDKAEATLLLVDTESAGA